MSGASFVYPPDGNFSVVAPSGDVNYFDTLEITYSSNWSALNFTLFCLIGDSSTDYGVYQAPGNPLASSGTFRLASIASAGFSIVHFPAPCSFKLTQYGDNDIATGGDPFEVVSQPGTSTTYKSTATAAASSTSITSQAAATTQSSPTETTSTNTSISKSSASSNTSSPSSGQSATASSSASSIGSSTSQPVAQEVGLSTGAKAGIGVGVAVAVLAILGLCFVIFRLRRKNNRPVREDLPVAQDQTPMHDPPKSEKSPYVNDNPSELEQTSRVELPTHHAQQRRIGPMELE